jgi:hypothetical protein
MGVIQITPGAISLSAVTRAPDPFGLFSHFPRSLYQ